MGCDGVALEGVEGVWSPSLPTVRKRTLAHLEPISALAPLFKPNNSPCYFWIVADTHFVQLGSCQSNRFIVNQRTNPLRQVQVSLVSFRSPSTSTAHHNHHTTEYISDFQPVQLLTVSYRSSFYHSALLTNPHRKEVDRTRRLGTLWTHRGRSYCSSSRRHRSRTGLRARIVTVSSEKGERAVEDGCTWRCSVRRSVAASRP